MTKVKTVVKDLNKTIKGEESPSELASSRSGRFLLRKLLLPVGAGVLTALAFHAIQRLEEDDATEQPTDGVEHATAKAVWWLPVIRLGSTLLKTYLDHKIKEEHPAS